MLGLPLCEQVDEAESIIDLIKKIHYLTRKQVEINITVSPFVPKPHTPFEREAQQSMEYFNEQILKIKRGLPRSIKVKNHDVQGTLIEGILARGDERLTDVIVKSYLDGCRMDSWHEFFRYDLWEKNLNELPNWEKYLASRPPEEVLPWSVIDTGFEKLIESRKNKNIDLSEIKSNEKINEKVTDLPKISTAGISELEKKFATEKIIRLKLKKVGRAKYIPHIDFMEIIKRALRISKIPVAFTQGFNKQEKLTFGYPIPLGTESLSEICNVEVYSTPSAEALEKFNDSLPRGIELISFEYTNEKKSWMTMIKAFEYEFKIKNKEVFDKIKYNINSKPTLTKTTKTKTSAVIFDEAVLKVFYKEDAQDKENTIQMTLSAGTENSIRADSIILQLSGLSNREITNFKITKLGQYIEVNGRLVMI
jgi:radical SAM-linked protein